MGSARHRRLHAALRLVPPLFLHVAAAAGLPPVARLDGSAAHLGRIRRLFRGTARAHVGRDPRRPSRLRAARRPAADPALRVGRWAAVPWHLAPVDTAPLARVNQNALWRRSTEFS